LTANSPWLTAAWKIVRPHLPAPPAAVLEIGCGPLGGFVPELNRLGYDAVGIDPNAPDGLAYRHIKFEEADLSQPVQAVIACTALHHVEDLDQTADRIATTLQSSGTVVVVEWAWERFNERTARWCFARLGPAAPGTEPGWLHRHQERWRTSGQTWDRYFQAWATEHGLHTGGRVLEALDRRFQRTFTGEGSYFFCDLDQTSEADEQAAINAGEIEATRILYVASAA
jgi:SAM-dependent methyltransferase